MDAEQVDAEQVDAEQVDVVVLTALPKEHRALIRAFAAASTATDTASPFFTSIGDTSVVLQCIANMGNVSAATAAQRALTRWHPSHIVLCGIAGGVESKGERCLGDVVVSEQVVYYEVAKRTSNELRPRYRGFPADRRMVACAKLLHPAEWIHSITITRPDNTSPRVIPVCHFGVLASGEKVVASRGFIEKLRESWSELIGIEMEAGGVATACHESDEKCGFIVVKGICDWANSDKNDDWQEYAADAAACFTKALLASTTHDRGVHAGSPSSRELTFPTRETAALSLGKADGSEYSHQPWVPAAFANLFLEFLNPESRRIYGLYENTSDAQHLRLISQAMNVAAFLCGEYCILPAGSIAECSLLQRLLTTWDAYMLSGLLRLPMRETSLDEFFEKRLQTYAPDCDYYPVLFDPDNPARRQLRIYASALVSRATRVGDRIVDLFGQGPDALRTWHNVKASHPRDHIEVISSAPRMLLHDGRAITWPALRSVLGSAGLEPSSDVRALLQRTYCDIYISEYGLKYLTGVPFARYRILGSPPDLAYDYRALEAALSPLRLWKPIVNASPAQLVLLRLTYGFFEFRKAFDMVVRSCTSTREVAEAFARIARRVDRGYVASDEVMKLEGRLAVGSRTPIGNDEFVDIVAKRLDKAAGICLELVADRTIGL